MSCVFGFPKVERNGKNRGELQKLSFAKKVVDIYGIYHIKYRQKGLLME